ncbi:hypothetical protein GCM10017673_40080 [Streptosporangium violaceochromogenes]|nr:hypothetical protein GCM10017673_40080 [Streptosporangium violaceochromogenes]
MTASPNGCRWCGVEAHDHAQRCTDTTDDTGRRVGWHKWAAPTDAQRLERMRTRRETAR